MLPRPWQVFAVALSWPLLGADPAPSVHVARYGVGQGPLGGARAIRIEGAPLVHTAQFLPIDNSGNVVGSDDPGAQVRQALDNLAQALDSARSSLDHLVRLNAVTADERSASVLDDEIEARFRLDSRPAVTLVRGELPIRGALVALDAVAASKISANVQQKPTWAGLANAAQSSGQLSCGCDAERPASLYFRHGCRGRTGSSRQRSSGANSRDTPAPRSQPVTTSFS